MKRALFCGAALLLGCADSGVVEIAVALEVAGTSTETFDGRDGWRIALSRADVAFGPLYLCAGDRAGDLCDTARAEWLDSVVIDALDPEPRRAGTLRGTSGVTRSWMYDHAITSLFTRQQPLVMDAAHALDGSSIAIAGVAERDGASVAFAASIPIRQEEDTEAGVPVVRRSGSDPFEHDIRGDEASLVVRFDAAPWLGDVDFTTLAEQGADLVLPADGNDFRSIRNAVVSGERPTFTWEE